MASPRIEGAKVAVLATNGFEQSELEQPVAALTAAGATVHVIAPKGPEIQGWEHHDKGRSTAVDVELAKAKAYLTGSYPLSFDSNSAIASNLMSVRLEDLGIDYFDKRNAMVEAVTMDDVNRIAATYLKPENFTFIVVGEPEGITEVATLPESVTGEVDIDEAGDMQETGSEETTDASRDETD